MRSCSSHHDSRLVRIAGITSNPVASWVTQQARNLSMDLADQANALKFLIRDRDTKFTASFDAIFATDSIRVIRTPVQAPRANAICERVIGTIRRECLDRMLILGRRHLAGLSWLSRDREELSLVNKVFKVSDCIT